MSRLILPSRFTSQPQYPAPIDGSSPIGRSVVSAALFSTGIVAPSGVGYKFSGTNLPDRVATRYGIGAGFNGSNDVLSVATPYYPEFTWSGRVYLGNTTSITLYTIASRHGSDGSTSDWALYRNAARNFVVDWPWGASVGTTAGTWSDNQWVDIALVRTGSSGSWTVKLYVNKVLAGSWTTASNPNTGTFPYTIGALSAASATNFTNNIYSSCVLLNRGLSQTEVIALANNPWQIFKAPSRPLFFSASGESNATGTGTPASITVSPTTASASGTASANGALASISITALTGTASAGTSATATGALASITVAPTTATATGRASGTGALAAVSLTAITGTASGTTAGNAIGTGTPASISIATPTGSATGSATTSAALSALSITAPTGTASAGVSATATGAIAGITLAPVTGSASGTSAGAANAVAAFAALHINPTTGAAFASAVAVGSLPILSITPAYGMAYSVLPPTVTPNIFTDVLPTLYSMMGDLVSHTPAGGGMTTTAPALPNSPGGIDLGNRVLVTDHALRYMTVSFPTVQKNDVFTISGVPYIVTEAPLSLLDGAERLAVLAKKP